MSLQDTRVPPAEVGAWFWEQFGHLIGPEARVFSLGMILPTGIQDSRGYRFGGFDLPPLEEGEAPTSEEFGEDTWVFFVDLEPSANWAHEAAYAAVDLQKELSMWSPTQWPPEAELVVEVARPVPSEMLDRFWREWGNIVELGGRVYLLGLREFVHLLDARGAHVLFRTDPDEPWGNQAWLFFVDQAPETKWPHVCAYVALDEKDACSIWTGWEWPPEGEWENLVKIARPVVDNVVGENVDWELRREMATAPRDVKHFGGVARCLSCGQEKRVVVRAPAWAYGPLPVECEACGGWALLVHHEVPVAEGEEPYFVIVVPAPDGPGGPE